MATGANVQQWFSSGGAIKHGTAGGSYYFDLGNVTFRNGDGTVAGGSITLPVINMTGNQGGTTILQPAAAASGTITFPAATDTLVGKSTTDILTNKTFDTAGTGNSFKINRTGITAVTGTGSAVLATSPALVTPTIGAGSTLTKFLVASAAIIPASVGANTCAEQPFAPAASPHSRPPTSPTSAPTSL